MSFDALGLLPSLTASLVKLAILEPSPVQRLAIPAMLGGKSVLAVARTGSGKTLAYGLALLHRLRAIEDVEGPVTVHARPRGLVLTGTRELVDQTVKVLKSVAHGPKLRVRGVAGGQTDRVTGASLKDPADVLVANPPRLRQLIERGLVSLEDVRVLILDEADTLCAPGQRPDVDFVLRTMPPALQLCLFSATLPEPMRVWCLALPQHPTLLLSRDAHAAPEQVKVHNIKLKPAERADIAHDLLVRLPNTARGILFANRRESAEAAGEILRTRGHEVVIIHGGQLPNERKRHITAFRKGEGRILVTTELGGRGIHIDDLTFVLNWEMPERSSDYLHRIGRVGRQGARGIVYNLVTQYDGPLLREAERLANGGRLDTGESVRAARERVVPQRRGPPTR